MIQIALFMPVGVLLVRFLRLSAPFRIGHVDLFNIGFFFYVSLPLLLSTLPQLRVLPLVEQWQMMVLGFSGAFLPWLLGFSLASWTAFHVGVLAGAAVAVTAPSTPRETYQHGRVINCTILVLGGLLAVYTVAHTYKYRSLLFAGYSDPEYSVSARGTLQLAMLLIFYLVAFGLERRNRVSSLVLWFNGLLAVLIVVVSLSMGTRQGFVTVAFATAVFLSTLHGRISRVSLVITAVCILCLLAFIGVWRMGGGGTGILMTAAIEPVANFISAFTMVGFNEMPAFGLPDEIAFGLLNLIPSALWPGKVQYLGQLAPDLTFVAPLGAQHCFVSMISAFGWVGSLAVFFLIGAGLQLLSATCLASRRAGIYAILAAVLAMDWWRNPLSITIVKVCLQAAVLWPIIVYLTSRAIGWLLEPDLRSPASETRSPGSFGSEAV